MLREYHPKRLVTLSRDELKQHDMRAGGFDQCQPAILYGRCARRGKAGAGAGGHHGSDPRSGAETSSRLRIQPIRGHTDQHHGRTQREVSTSICRSTSCLESQSEACMVEVEARLEIVLQISAHQGVDSSGSQLLVWTAEVHLDDTSVSGKRHPQTAPEIGGQTRSWGGVGLQRIGSKIERRGQGRRIAADSGRRSRPSSFTTCRARRSLCKIFRCRVRSDRNSPG
jgi:hypothetical protein